MSTTTQPAWKHSEVFPIIARLIGEEYQRHGRFIVAHEIAARLLQDGEARAIIDAARQQQQDWSLEHRPRTWSLGLVSALPSASLHTREHSSAHELMTSGRIGPSPLDESVTHNANHALQR